MKDFQSFHQQQCEWLKEESLEAVSKASLETSQISEMTKSMASCNLYEKMCFTGGIFPRDPVLGPCIRASRSFDKRFTEALKLQK